MCTQIREVNKGICSWQLFKLDRCNQWRSQIKAQC